MTAIKRYFPEDKERWKIHLKLFLPIILGSSFFALNGFVDNFMVGFINQGVTALAAINSWGNIAMGVWSGIAAAGAIAMAQFYFSGDYKSAIQIAKIRYLLSIIVGIMFALAAWVIPDQMISLFLKGDMNDSNYRIAFEQSRIYLKVIAIQWILISITFNLGNQLRETGFGKISMYWSFATLATNMTLNSIFMYGLNMGVVGAAWASVASRLVALTWGIVYIIKWKMKLGFNPWTIFHISKKMWTIYFKRWYLVISFSTVIFFITFRNYFFDAGYKVETNSPLGQGVGALMILGLTSAIQNIFTTTFNALAAMASFFVASELGKGNIKKAKENSLRLKGFNTLMSVFLSLLLVIFALATPYLTFLSNNTNDQTVIDHAAHLRHVRNSLLVIALFYPTWIWVMSSYRNALTGGKGIWFAIADWFITGPIQLSWLAILMYLIVPNSHFLQINFAVTYFLFFLTDWIKLVVIEILYHKTNWARIIVKH